MTVDIGLQIQEMTVPLRVSGVPRHQKLLYLARGKPFFSTSSFQHSKALASASTVSDKETLVAFLATVEGALLAVIKSSGMGGRS